MRYLTLMHYILRLGSELNRRLRVLQTPAFPLGYQALFEPEPGIELGYLLYERSVMAIILYGHY